MIIQLFWQGAVVKLSFQQIQEKDANQIQAQQRYDTNVDYSWYAVYQTHNA